jgi:hypothetical protein
MHLFLAYYTSHEQEYLFLVYFTYLWSILLLFRRFFYFARIKNLEEFFVKWKCKRMDRKLPSEEWNLLRVRSIGIQKRYHRSKDQARSQAKNLTRLFWTCISKLGLK